jgi:uncharacterized membrane protein YgcG
VNRSLIFRSVLLLSLTLALGPSSSAAEDDQETPVFKPEELEQLVAPIALYPDSLVAQVLMASTYPLEVVEAARWAKDNPDLEGDALEVALQKQTWDASVKSLTAFPQVLTMMNEKLDWTQKLGDAFLAQQNDVMDAVQRLRGKAKAEGNLETNKEQKVTVEQAPVTVEQKVVVEAPAQGAAPAAPPQQTIIKIEPASPQVVYVPTYNPTVVYGAWPYPAYPPYYYYPPGYVATASVISFGVGLAVGAALWGDCHWGGYGGHNNVKINVNNYNNFNHTNISNNNWNHNSVHRKGVQYRDGQTQQRYGRGQTQAAKSREDFRGRAESGRRDLQGAGGDKVRRDLDRGDRGGAGADRAASARRDAPQQRAADKSKPRAPQAKPRAQERSSQARAGQPSQARSADAFRDMNHGRQTRDFSDRGRSSRQSASARGGGGGGGGRRGGGGGGGGRR